MTPHHYVWGWARSSQVELWQGLTLVDYPNMEISQHSWFVCHIPDFVLTIHTKFICVDSQWVVSLAIEKTCWPLNKHIVSYHVYVYARISSHILYSTACHLTTSFLPYAATLWTYYVHWSKICSTNICVYTVEHNIKQIPPNIYTQHKI